MVWERFEEIRATYPCSSVSTERMWVFGRKREEFLADVLLVAKRALSEADWRLFDLHFVRGLEWFRCCPQLGYSRGYFFHAVYRVQEALGRAWVEVQPFPLCRPSGYFSDHRPDAAMLNSRPLRPAVWRAAASGRLPAKGGTQRRRSIIAQHVLLPPSADQASRRKSKSGCSRDNAWEMAHPGPCDPTPAEPSLESPR
jgi:hypothetical protein